MSKPISYEDFETLMSETMKELSCNEKIYDEELDENDFDGKILLGEKEFEALDYLNYSKGYLGEADCKLSIIEGDEINNFKTTNGYFNNMLIKIKKYFEESISDLNVSCKEYLYCFTSSNKKIVFLIFKTFDDDTNYLYYFGDALTYKDSSIIREKLFFFKDGDLINEYGNNVNGVSIYINTCKLQNEKYFLNKVFFEYDYSDIEKEVKMKSLFNLEETSEYSDLLKKNNAMLLDMYKKDDKVIVKNLITEEEINISFQNIDEFYSILDEMTYDYTRREIESFFREKLKEKRGYVNEEKVRVTMLNLYNELKEY